MVLRRWSVPAFGLILLSCMAVSAQPPARRANAPLTNPAVQPGAIYKGIFEPVNYGQDINLTDVFFVSPDVGWVSGEHATILKTTDGGTTWKAQVGGDPNSTEKPIGQLRFLDARHGWAVTGDDRLLRTVDGENWEQIGSQPAPGSGFIDYAFTSVRHGIALGGNMGGFFVTNDGGGHWHNVATCKVRAVVQGLARTEDCRVKKLQMLSGRLGYASADWSNGVAFLRTNDGGEHWTSIVNDVSDWSGNNDFFFIDLDHGVVLMNGSARTYVTSDGAKTWHALLSGSIGLSTGGLSPLMKFADPEVGWVIGPSPDNSDTFRVSYSTDSGQHWKMSHNIKFPVGPRYGELKFNLPRRDRAYVVGEHGMIYRYRIVPANYSVANSLDAPLMPSVGDPVLQARTQRVRADIAALQAKLSAALASGSTPASASPINTGSSLSALTGSDASAATNSGTDTSASSATSGNVTDATSLTPDSTSGATVGATDANAANSTDPAAASGSPEGTANPTSDSTLNATATVTDTTSSPPIDTAAPSAPVAACCAAQVQTLQSDVGGLTQQLPSFAGKFRSLNMIVAGLQIFSDLMNKAQTMRDTLRTLKHAPSLQAASAALMQLASNVQSTQQSITAELQNPGSVVLPASDAAAPPAAAQAFTQPANAAAQQDATTPRDAAAQSNTPTPVPQNAAPAAPTTPSSDSSSSPGAVTQAEEKVQKAKDKVKKTMGGWIPH